MTTTTKLASSYRGRKRHQISFAGQGRTHQEHKAECDINTIVTRWRKSGEVAHQNPHEGGFGDFSDGADYHTQVNRIMEAEEAFQAIPARVRAIAQNSPATFLDMCDDPQQLELLVDAGLKLEPRGERPQSSERSSDPEPDTFGRSAPPPAIRSQPDTREQEPNDGG